MPPIWGAGREVSRVFLLCSVWCVEFPQKKEVDSLAGRMLELFGKVWGLHWK